VVAVIPDGCVGLDVREDGSASGALHPHQFQFMPMIGYMPDQLPSGEPRGLTGTPRPWRQPPDVLFAGGLEQCSFAALALTVLVSRPASMARLAAREAARPDRPGRPVLGRLRPSEGRDDPGWPPAPLGRGRAASSTPGARWGRPTEIGSA